jgi:hypothetical protein
MRRFLTIVIVIVAMICQLIGGIIDYQQADSISIGKMTVTKQHMWSDAQFLVLLAILINMSDVVKRK